jgi:hypothetical protein
MNDRFAPKPYQGKKKRRWPTRIFVGAVSLGGLLGLWQLVANEPVGTPHDTPTLQDAQQQLQLGTNNTPVINHPPDVISGVS